MSSKPRPDNTPGSNGLRGGIKQYSPKTTTGQWLESYGGTARYKRGFTTSEFITEGQHQQKGATLKPPLEFGAGLPIPETVSESTSFTSEIFNPSNGLQSSEWLTTSKVMTLNVSGLGSTAPLEGERKKPVGNNITRDEVAEYRKKWTTDSYLERKTRYQTESRLSAIADNKFRVDCIRALPGTPKGMDLLRDQLIKKFGILAISAIKSYVGKGIVTADELQAAIRKSGCVLKQFEFTQIIAFITPSTDVSTEAFFRALKGTTSGFDTKIPRDIFQRVGQNAATVTVEDVIAGLDDGCPELAEGIREFVDGVYTDSEGRLKAEDFIAFFEDMYNSAPANYPQTVKLWRN